jgi:hypothetical protein
MDPRSFDHLTASVAHQGSRRAALRLLAGGLFGGFLAGRGVVPAAAQRSDRDGDGLYDDDETDVYGTNPDSYDTDGDGVGDGEEIYNRDQGLGGPSDPLTPDGGGAPPAPPAPAGGGLNERATGPGADGCQPGLTQCAGFCVDVTNDFYNCGMCSNRCLGRDGGYCENNFCVYPCIAAGTC